MPSTRRTHRRPRSTAAVARQRFEHTAHVARIASSSDVLPWCRRRRGKARREKADRGVADADVRSIGESPNVRTTRVYHTLHDAHSFVVCATEMLCTRIINGSVRARAGIKVTRLVLWISMRRVCVGLENDTRATAAATRGAIRRRTRCALDDAMRCDAMRCARGPRVPLFCFVTSHASSRVAAARAMRASAIAGTTTTHVVVDDDDWFRAPSRARATLESVKKHSNAWLLRQSRGRGSCRAQPRVSS